MQKKHQHFSLMPRELGVELPRCRRDAYGQNGVPYEDGDGDESNQGRDNNGLPGTAQQGLSRTPFFWQKGDHLERQTDRRTHADMGGQENHVG